jgi:hypothetical protein
LQEIFHINDAIGRWQISSKNQVEIGKNVYGELRKFIKTLECNGGAGKEANERKMGQRE